MKPLFDFGISQEDPLTEKRILDLQSSDRILSVASGGEVPLSLLSLVPSLSITAVDISVSQVMLCRLKLVTALTMDLPLSGGFLGYSRMNKDERKGIFRRIIKPSLSNDESAFWEKNIRYIERGVAGSGRFEGYIRKMRFAAVPIIGRSNVNSLINSASNIQQISVFQKSIATRSILRLVFRIAFHPKLYRKRGLSEQALIHGSNDTGNRFYSRFEDFCTSTPASENYFLQYFLTGKCLTNDSYPEYLKPGNRKCLEENISRLELKTSSFQDAISEKPNGYFNKIHFSNLGDWMDSHTFSETIKLISARCQPGTKICLRYLQKDHFTSGDYDGIKVDRSVSAAAQKSDRFPFYTTYLLVVQ